MWHPLFRIDDFPILVLVGGSGCDIRVFFGHDVPSGAVSLLERQALAVRTMAQDHRILARFDRPIYIGIKPTAIPGSDGYIPIHVHAIESFGFLDIGHARLLDRPKTALVWMGSILIDQLLFKPLPF
jgi:hypothetical protein